MGVRAAARAFGLDFVPITQEPYDLIMERATAESEPLQPLWELMATPGFRTAVEALGGYDTSQMGDRIR
jgi:putative molybdopterin biosynthesis protein